MTNYKGNFVFLQGGFLKGLNLLKARV